MHIGAKALNGSLGPGTQDPNEGTQMLGPKYWDPNSEVRNVRVPSAGTHRPGTQMKGPRYRDPSKGQRHIMGPARLEALYGSPKVGGTLWVPRLEALNGSPKVRGTLRVSGL